MEKRNFALGKKNYILIAIAICLIVIGFLLMSGGGSTDSISFNPDIFSARRIRIAPIVVLSGFLIMIIAIIYQPKEKNTIYNKDLISDNKKD
ncbi:MAG: DUF3098 domain-containing protein [Massilibacteroides sp.]|nr:DUF3098 domain-containing protein [Massilibacteroides sp.]